MGRLVSKWNPEAALNVIVNIFPDNQIWIMIQHIVQKQYFRNSTFGIKNIKYLIKQIEKILAKLSNVMGN